MINGAESDAKLADLKKDIQDTTAKGTYATTDFGTKVANHEEWLKVGSETYTGSSLPSLARVILLKDQNRSYATGRPNWP